MADINATNLTPETLSTLDGTENIVAFDTAEGKKIPLSVLGDYVVQKLTQTLMGQTQTVQDAFGMLQAKTYSLTGVGITMIPENGDLNDYTGIGIYGQATNATAQTIANKPSDLTTGFKMYVEELSPAASDTGKYRYRRQVLIAQTENSPMYIRRFTTSNTGSTWTWRNWEKMPTRTEMDTVTTAIGTFETTAISTVESGANLEWSSGTLTNGLYLLVLDRVNNSDNTRAYLALINIHTTSHIAEIYKGENAPTDVAVSSKVLTFTRTINTMAGRLIRL